MLAASVHGSSFSSCELAHQPQLLPASTHQLRHLHDHHHHRHPQQQQQHQRSLSSIRFTGDQIACLCDAMQQIGHVDRLVSFVWSLSPAELLAGSEPVIRARATVAFHQGKYRELYSLLEGHNFDPANHAALQQLWYRAHYAEAEKIRGRPLGQRLDIITTALTFGRLLLLVLASFITTQSKTYGGSALTDCLLPHLFNTIREVQFLKLRMH